MLVEIISSSNFPSVEGKNLMGKEYSTCIRLTTCCKRVVLENLFYVLPMYSLGFNVHLVGNLKHTSCVNSCLFMKGRN